MAHDPGRSAWPGALPSPDGTEDAHDTGNISKRARSRIGPSPGLVPTLLFVERHSADASPAERSHEDCPRFDRTRPRAGNSRPPSVLQTGSIVQGKITIERHSRTPV